MAGVPADPDVLALLAAGRAAGAQPFETMPPIECRAAYDARRGALQKPPEPVAGVEDRTIPGPGGPLALRLFRGTAVPERNAPALLYLHGGGWVVGNLDSHEGVCRRLANEARCLVVAVDYRLAPEHPFPAAVEDGLAALRWLAGAAGEVGVDPARIAVGGDSAGGNLAAVLALMARDGEAPPVCFQVLLYPSTDLAASHGEATEGMTITAATMRYFIDHYAPDARVRTDPRASPLRAASLAGAPAALVLTCGHDPLCDEGRAYAARLEQEGVAVTHLHLAAQTHGMLTLNRIITAADDVLAYVGAALRGAWRTGAA